MTEMKNRFRTDPEQMMDLMKVALGQMEADLAIVNGDIVNVYTGEILAGNTVLVKGDRIAYVGKNGAGSVGSSTEVIDAAGKTVIPGLIDGHTHIDNPYTPDELVRYAMKGGVTTVITEVDEIAFTLGYRGIIQFLKAVENQPVKILITVPPMVTISRAAEEQAITVRELRKLLKRKDVIGLGEPYWIQVINGNRRVMELIAETINSGMTVEGHSAGARDNKLQAYFASGISSCHEPITAEEARERLRLGLFLPVREGEVRRDLEAISKLKDENIDLDRLVLSTDGIGPEQLVAEGYLEFVVQKAIDLGFDPVTAIKMATIHPAQRFGLDNFIGGIAPGKLADIVIIPELSTIRPERVISNGKLIFRDGALLIEPEKYAYPAWTEKSIRLTRDFTDKDFAVPVDKGRRRAGVRIMDLITPLVTREAVIDFPVKNGELVIDVSSDLVKIAAIERDHVPGKTFTGFVRGFNLKSGAMATSSVWDLNGIIVVGASESDMALAVNRIRQLKGGTVVCSGNRVLAEMALPIGGVVSREPMEILARQLGNIQQAAAGLGFPYPDLRTTMSVMATSAIPFLRICEDGLYSINRDSLVDLIVD